MTRSPLLHLATKSSDTLRRYSPTATDLLIADFDEYAYICHAQNSEGG